MEEEIEMEAETEIEEEIEEAIEIKEIEEDILMKGLLDFSSTLVKHINLNHRI